MRIMYRYLSLFLSLVFFAFPAGAGPGAMSGYGNFTGEWGWNATQNASDYYFNSSSNWSCFTAGEIEGYVEEIAPDDIVEEVTFLTHSPESELFPVWTADGNYIVYMVQGNESGNSESYRMKADGSEIERTGVGEGNLTGFNDINPNGTELILTKSTDSLSGLYLASLENGTISPVADDPDISESWGAWCRLGKKIVYTQESEDSPSQLWIVDRDGSNKIRLGTSENVGTGKDWCPLGLKILYSARNSKEKPDLWTIDWYGTNQTQLTDTPYGEWNPALSPDGKRVAYVSDEEGKTEIWLRDLEGNYRVKLTDNISIIDSNPKWSPDGSKIVFTARNLQNISESAVVNNTDITLLSSANSSSINSSDIAIIKLMSAPSPKITSVKIDSIHGIYEEGAANISITVRNEGRNASKGYIWVSFPDGRVIESVNGTGGNINVYPEGSLIQGKYGRITAQYSLVEFAESEWARSQEKTLNMTVLPNNESEEIVFFVRTALKNDLTGTYMKDPQFSTDLDQQGLEVYKYSV